MYRRTELRKYGGAERVQTVSEFYADHVPAILDELDDLAHEVKTVRSYNRREYWTWLLIVAGAVVFSIVRWWFE